MNVLDRFRLDGKRLFITGGSRGFGRAIALAAAEAGADIILNGRDPDALARTAAEIRERGRQVWTFPADIAQPQICEALCRRVLAEAGPIDILVNNVGGRNLDVAIEDTDLDTWQRFVDPRTASEYVSLVTGVIKGATELNTTPVSDTATLQQALDNLGVTAPDDHTLQVTFEKPAPFFLDIAALGNMAPVRQNVVEKGGDKWTEAGSLIGNGPFVLKAWTKGSDMTLAPNPNYYEGAPKLQNLTFNFIADDPTAFANYQADEIDISNTVPQAEIPGIRTNPQFQDQIVQSSQLATYMFGFNTTKPPFNDQKVREALSLAIDRKTLTDQVLNGVPTPAYSFIPPGMPGHLTQDEAGDAAKAQTFDPARAKQLLAEAGYPNGQGFPEIKLAFNNNSSHSLIGQRVQSDLQTNLGVKITLDPREPKTYFNDIQKNPPDLFRTGWNADYPDPYDWDQLVFGPGSDQNYGKWQNDQFTQLLAQADKATNADTRIHYYQEAEQVLAQDVGAIFVYWYGNFTLVKPWIKGLTYTSQDPTPGAYSFKDAQILKH